MRTYLRMIIGVCAISIPDKGLVSFKRHKFWLISVLFEEVYLFLLFLGNVVVLVRVYDELKQKNTFLILRV